MYKLLLCWRYLKTRYLAFACIISVMLGVATLIVVNSVMNGFSTKLRGLLHSVMSDAVVESAGFEGFHDPAGKVRKIRQHPYLNEQIESMAVTLEAFAMVQFRHRFGEIATRPVRVIGIEPKSRIEVGGFEEHLSSYVDYQKKKTSTPPPKPEAIFDLPPDIRKAFEENEARIEREREFDAVQGWKKPTDELPLNLPPELKDIFKDAKAAPAAPRPVPHKVRVPQGVIVGYLIAHFSSRDPSVEGGTKENCAIEKGDWIMLTTVSGQRLTPVYDSFVVVDYFRSEMSDFDGNCVFVPLEHLQHLRNMDNRATNILIKLKNYANANKVRDELSKLFAGEMLSINTWEDKQGPLLRAIEIEKGILDVLLFMIIAVAGFGILSIFSMIVAEKTRDIGILKALGASNGGVMKIFLSYGLLLGIVGAGCGTILGLSITFHINEVEMVLSLITGSRLFTGEVYYFNEIPTNVSPLAVVIVNLGAMVIAIVFSILPALRAAMLHPVQALRYE
jgi:lipoprotein-releasing system permease protein